MSYEVVVVGGGIGGLTTAALLAARGVSVCLLERQPRVGGCLANFEHLDHQFEPTNGMYSGWESGGTFEGIFSELPVQPPVAERLSPSYTVRLPDNSEITISDDLQRLEADLRHSFPECADAAVAFYRELIGSANSNSGKAPRLTDCSQRFRRFLDVQLETLTQRSSEACPDSLCLSALLAPMKGLWSIRGGAQSLAAALAASIRTSGGTVKLDSPVLRLAYRSDGQPDGLDLLSGERITATRALISNLTVWDTYGKLVGMSRVPSAISSQLKQLHAWGAYQVFLSVDEEAAARLNSRRIVALTDWQTDQSYEPVDAQFVFAAASLTDPRAPSGKVAATVSTFTNTDDWFAFHDDPATFEEQDQQFLEAVWSRLHAALPELGDGVEVIETATPQTFYETTRRRLGMVGGVMGSSSAALWQTPFPNVFIVGDTVSHGLGIEGVAQTSVQVANVLT
jgi:prolycopene isomerase